MEGHLVMSKKERRRKVEFEGVREGRLTIKEAAAKLGCPTDTVGAPISVSARKEM